MSFRTSFIKNIRSKGMAGDVHNALLAGTGYSLKMRFNQIKGQIVLWLEVLMPIFANVFLIKNFKTQKTDF